MGDWRFCPPSGSSLVTTPNWQHNSGKPPHRTLKPQAVRAARKRRAALKAKLLAGAKV